MKNLVRFAVWGMVGAIAIVVAIALTTAAIMDQQPFNMHKGSRSDCIDVARCCFVPAAIVIGPLLGIMIGLRYNRIRSSKPKSK
jgi:hypothetical protein